MIRRILFIVALLASFSRAASAAAPQLPIVVVFPFSATAGLQPDAGVKLAALVDHGLSEGGKVTTRPAPLGTERVHFLEAARGAGADYYVSGYLTPVGSDVSLVTQVVTTSSGIAVWSNTLQLRAYGDATAEVELVQAAIARHASRGFAAAAVTASAAPAPVASATLPPAAPTRRFGRKRPVAAASTAPVAMPNPLPLRAIAVVVNGSADASLRLQATRALTTALRADGMTPVPAAASEAAEIEALRSASCAGANVRSVMLGTLAAPRPRNAEFKLVVAPCASGAPQSYQLRSRENIDELVAQTYAAYAHPRKRR